MSKTFDVKQILPDLIISDLEFDVKQDQENGLVMINITKAIVSNRGEASTQNNIWRDVVFMECTSGLKVNIFEKTISWNVKAKETYEINSLIHIKRSKSSSCTLVFRADFYDTLYESTDKNNIFRSKPFRLPQLDDDVTVSISEVNEEAIESLLSGNTYSYVLTFENRKTYPTGSYIQEELYLEVRKNLYFLQQFVQSTMKGNEKVNKTIKVVLPENIFGSALLTLKHDTMGKLINNPSRYKTVTKKINIQLPPSPDLQPVFVNYEDLKNNRLKITWSVVNNGNHMKSVRV